MDPMREIGRTLTAEQNLADEDITWLIAMAQAVLRAFAWTEGLPMRSLAATLGISPQTLYTTLRVVVQAMMWVRQGQTAVGTLANRLQAVQARLASAEHAATAAQAEVQRLTRVLAEAQAQVGALQGEVARLQVQWGVMQDRLIVVLTRSVSGRCTVRSIVEVLEYGLGVHVSVGYVQGVIAQASLQARSVWERVLQVVPLSGAICLDEVFFKELACQVLGIVIVDPLTGLVLRLERCTERSKDAIGAVLQHFNAAGFQAQIKLCLTDMYEGYLKPIQTYLPQAVHQFCWFHLNCFHLGATVHRAERAYQRTVEALATFDKKHASSLAEADQQHRRDLVAARDLAQRQWLGAQRLQRLLSRLLWSPSLAVATARLDQLIRVAAQMNNPYLQKMGMCLTEHRAGLLVFFLCLESGQHQLKRLSRSQQRWVALTTRWALPITSNAAEHVFRCLRRYTNNMDHFVTSEATQHFFDLFVFFHNLHVLRAGQQAGHSLLAAAHVDLVALLGTDDPYTMLGFPPATQAFTPMKSVQLAVGGSAA
jgi:hypothetical protein